MGEAGPYKGCAWAVQRMRRAVQRLRLGRTKVAPGRTKFAPGRTKVAPVHRELTRAKVASGAHTVHGAAEAGPYKGCAWAVQRLRRAVQRLRRCIGSSHVQRLHRELTRLTE